MFLLWQRTAKVMQLNTGAPSIITVHAPHAPESHPSLVPIKPNWPLSKSKSVRFGSTDNSTRSPLTVKTIFFCNPNLSD